MVKEVPKRCNLINLKMKDWQYEFALDNSLSAEEINLLAVNRKTKEELSIPCEKIESEKEQYRVAINLDEIADHVSDKGCLDFYAAYKNSEGDLLRKRIKAEHQPIELSWEWDERKGVFFLPYTTKKGNFSLKVLQKKAVAEVSDFHLSPEGLLTIKGFAFLLNEEATLSVQKRRLILKEVKQAEARIFEYPLEDFKQKDIPDENVGFIVKIDMKKLYEENIMPALFQFHIEFLGEDPETGEPFIRRSKAIQFKDHSNQFAILQTNKGVARFYIYPRKKKRHMRLRMNDYSLKTRVVYFVKGKRNKLVSFFRKKKKKVKKKIDKGLKKAYHFTFGLAGHLPVKRKSVIFESFAGKQYSCNPRAIYEYMQKNLPDYHLYWSVNADYTNIFEEKDIPYIRRFSMKWLFAMARAEYWVVNSRLPLWIPKPKHTTYLQTWHGTPLKRLAVDMEEVHMPGTNTEKYKQNFTSEAAKWDYLISPNAYSTEIFARAFQFNKTMIESGYPRNDFLHTDNNPDTVRALKEKMLIPLDKKVMIYAPTWRDDQFYKKGKYKFDLDLDLDMLKDEIGDEYVIILRMHYLVAENFDLEPYKGFAYDFSSYEDIRELYMVSDLLITDYSSVFFDFANLKRPMIFYVPDIETYRDKLRGFYFDFENEAPGPLVKTTDEVIEKIRETETPEYRLPQIFAPFYEKFCYLETGQSTEKVVKEVFNDKV
ncbi:CDP-glycerol glycerophosphotransferase family protein [Bacillus changyiensis]|uniref:CDP-glycerol glycerophosphotransferase family protein n=1 Tax=Bacillus changyiensis TaxID=3004103 RepID=UPI0022E1CE21|nr:CDP-glycerol glycerophosphotransferase family protein [Bacillus changyiensis]MDA1476599.1 CDP-glycerol glycerophosphotransferase family protein [Bacillus changyiensis]